MEVLSSQTLQRPAQRAVVRSKGRGYTVQVARNVIPLLAAEVGALVVSLELAVLARHAVTGEAASVVGYGWGVVPLYFVTAWLARLLPGWGLGAVEEFRRVILALGGAFALTATGLWLAHVNVGDAVVSSRLVLAIGGGACADARPPGPVGRKSGPDQK